MFQEFCEHYYSFALLAFLGYQSEALQCVDHYNKAVDWYVINKLPKQKHSNELISQGEAYTYITSREGKDWKLSTVSINATNSIIGLTLKPLFKRSTKILHILYNDQLPNKTTVSKKDHTKGLILGDRYGGLWLIHSVPRFPPVNARQYYYPWNGYRNGQSFLCISLDAKNLDKIGVQLQYTRPTFFSNSIPPNLEELYPNLVDVTDNVIVQSPPWNNLQSLSSVDGVEFVSFAKGPRYGKELYIDWIAPKLRSNLSVQTWLNTPNRLPSQCKSFYCVYNVKEIYINAAKLKYETTKDHSKWAVASYESQFSEWICIGDINRAESQRRRGGGSVCFQMQKVAEAYRNIIAATEKVTCC